MAGITEIEIQLYIDHSLPQERKLAVKKHLFDDLSAAQRVGASERHADALRRVLGPVAEMPLPSIFEPSNLETELSLPPTMPLNSITGALFAILVIYVALGWGGLLEHQMAHYLLRWCRTVNGLVCS